MSASTEGTKSPVTHEVSALTQPEMNFDFAATSRSKRKTSLILLSAGASVGVITAVFIPISANRIERRRQALLANCDVQVNGPDSCAHAKPGQQDNAQSASNSIATWKMVRTTAWVGLAAGAAAAATGGSLLIFSNRKPSESPNAAQVSFDTRHLLLFYQGQF
jgi:hypothetical protein